MSGVTSPTAAVLIIGDEILSGRTRDTNLNTLARFLTALGIDLKEARTVGDTPDQIIDAVKTLSAGHDYLFTTGGIGPTHDDITADCVAEAMGVALPENTEAMAILERRYGDELNDARRRMARIPEGGSLIANPVTDAPGFQIGNVFVMAGVPKIMTAMLDDVAPRLRVGAITHARTLKVEGVGEGDVAELLTAAADANRTLSFGSYPFGHGTVGEYGTQLVVRGRDASALSAAVEALKEAVEVTLADRGVRVFEVRPEG